MVLKLIGLGPRPATKFFLSFMIPHPFHWCYLHSISAAGRRAARWRQTAPLARSVTTATEEPTVRRNERSPTTLSTGGGYLPCRSIDTSLSVVAQSAMRAGTPSVQKVEHWLPLNAVAIPRRFTVPVGCLGCGVHILVCPERVYIALSHHRSLVVFAVPTIPQPTGSGGRACGRGVLEPVTGARSRHCNGHRDPRLRSIAR